MSGNEDGDCRRRISGIHSSALTCSFGILGARETPLNFSILGCVTCVPVRELHCFLLRAIVFFVMGTVFAAHGAQQSVDELYEYSYSVFERGRTSDNLYNRGPGTQLNPGKFLNLQMHAVKF